MKKVSRCMVCGRDAYTNDDHYCKRCYREAQISGKITADIPEPEGSIIVEEE